MENKYLELSRIELSTVGRKLRIMLLADDRHPAGAVRDHINAFSLYSSNTVEIVNPIHAECLANSFNSEIDVIIIHYSIFTLSHYFLPVEWACQITRFRGPKIQIIQDEYRNIDSMKAQMFTLGIDSVLSSLSLINIQKVYGGPFMERTNVYSSLPGYVSERLLQLPKTPLQNRQYDVVYRGRKNVSLGLLSKEKEDIGTQMSLLADEWGLDVNIGSEESERLYGESWDEFLTSGRAMLGVEGGSSIFDFDGSIQKDVEEHIKHNPEAGFDSIWEAILRHHEGNLVHKTITPKIFEAILLKTALVLYSGEYRGILKPGKHYIELKRDGSNIKDVVAKLRDQAFLTNLVDTVYTEITQRQDLTFQYYINRIDEVVKDILKSNASDGISFGETFFKEKLAFTIVGHNKKENELRETVNQLKQNILNLEHEINSKNQFNEMITNERNDLLVVIDEEGQLKQNILNLENEINSKNQLIEMITNERNDLLEKIS